MEKETYIIKDLMGIITPEEIDELTIINLNKKKESLTSILLSKLQVINEKKESKNNKKSIHEDSEAKTSCEKVKSILSTYKQSAISIGKKKQKETSVKDGVLINKKQS